MPYRKAMKAAGLLLALLTLVLLLMGYLIGVGMGHQLTPGASQMSPAWPPSPGPANLLPDLSPTTSPTDIQTSLLVLAVDTLAPSGTASPTLEGCWIITFLPDAPQYYLVGVPVGTVVGLPGAAPQSLRDIYATDARLKRGNVFTRDALAALYPGLTAPQMEVSFDRATLKQGIDLLGGLPLNGELRLGADVLAYYDAIPAEDVSARMDFQSTVLVNVLQIAKDRHWTLENLSAFLNLGQPWFPDYATAIFLMRSAPPLEDAEFIPLLSLPTETSPAP